jgi:GAF domain-containing protein
MSLHKEPSAYERQLIALGRTLQALREEGSTDTWMEVTLNYLRTECQYVLIWLALYHTADHALQGCTGVIPGTQSPLLTQRISIQPGDLFEQVVIQQRAVAVADLREEHRAGEWRDIARKCDVQGSVIFPIRHQDRCLGLALLGSPVWGISPSSEEKARLSMVLGELAATLAAQEAEKRRQQSKNPAEPLFALLPKLQSLPTLQQRLDALVETTHQFIKPSRTSIYWVDPDRYCFWRRATLAGTPTASSQSKGQAKIEISIEEVMQFYQTLTNDQLVIVGEATSLLRADTTGRLIQKIQAQSLLAAPILAQGRLIGFLSAEGNDARIWSDAEKDYLRGAAQLMAIAAPLETMESTIQRIQLDQALTADISHAIYSAEDWHNTLKSCAEQMRDRLGTDWFVVLLYDDEKENFEVCYQHPVAQCQPLPNSLEQLAPIDLEMVQRSEGAIAIESLNDTLKFMGWRELLMDNGVQSLLICSTSSDTRMEGLLLVGHRQKRMWNPTECNLMATVSRQIGLILHQWQLQRQTDQQEKDYQTIQWGLATMKQIHEVGQLEQAAMQNIAQVLQVPLAALVAWKPGHRDARIAATAVGNTQFTVSVDQPINIITDAFIQWVLQTDGVLPISVNELTVDARKWLSGAKIGQLLAMTLRTSAEHEPMGLVIVADHEERYWLDRHLNAFASLVDQLAWSRRHLLLTEHLRGQRSDLEQLNWYKQRRFEDIYRMLGLSIRRLNELSHQKDALASMRYHQVLRQLGDLLTSMAPVLKYENWKFKKDYQTVPLITLVRRSLDRVDNLIKQRQLWTQVHNEETVLIGCDIPKVEFVLNELLSFACRRSPNNSRLDIWCRPLDAQWLELSITDNGPIEPRMVEELHAGRPMDLLAPSTLDYPPGLHLVICQSLMKYIGGEFQLYKLEDGRVLSRLMLPIAPDKPTSQTAKS